MSAPLRAPPDAHGFGSASASLLPGAISGMLQKKCNILTHRLRALRVCCSHTLPFVLPDLLYAIDTICLGLMQTCSMTHIPLIAIPARCTFPRDLFPAAFNAPHISTKSPVPLHMWPGTLERLRYLLGKSCSCLEFLHICPRILLPDLGLPYEGSITITARRAL